MPNGLDAGVRRWRDLHLAEFRSLGEELLAEVEWYLRDRGEPKIVVADAIVAMSFDELQALELKRLARTRRVLERVKGRREALAEAERLVLEYGVPAVAALLAR